MWSALKIGMVGFRLCGGGSSSGDVMGILFLRELACLAFSFMLLALWCLALHDFSAAGKSCLVDLRFIEIFYG